MGNGIKKFKEHNRGQAVLFPQEIGSLIPENDVVKVVSSILDHLDVSSIISSYKGGGSTAFHPRMMLKVLIYAYLQGNYSCRKIAKSLRENIYYMWLSGNSTPTYKTINNFRSGKMKHEIEKIFGHLVEFCIKEKYINLDALYVDGTKMEAKHQSRIQNRVQEILAKVDQVNADEQKKYGDKDLPDRGEHINSDSLKDKIVTLSELINRDRRL